MMQEMEGNAVVGHDIHSGTARLGTHQTLEQVAMQLTKIERGRLNASPAFQVPTDPCPSLSGCRSHNLSSRPAAMAHPEFLQAAPQRGVRPLGGVHAQRAQQHSSFVVSGLRAGHSQGPGSGPASPAQSWRTEVHYLSHRAPSGLHDAGRALSVLATAIPQATQGLRLGTRPPVAQETPPLRWKSSARGLSLRSRIELRSTDRAPAAPWARVLIERRAGRAAEDPRGAADATPIGRAARENSAVPWPLPRVRVAARPASAGPRWRSPLSAAPHSWAAAPQPALRVHARGGMWDGAEALRWSEAGEGEDEGEDEDEEEDEEEEEEEGSGSGSDQDSASQDGRSAPSSRARPGTGARGCAGAESPRSEGSGTDLWPGVEGEGEGEGEGEVHSSRPAAPHAAARPVVGDRGTRGAGGGILGREWGRGRSGERGGERGGLGGGGGPGGGAAGPVGGGGRGVGGAARRRVALGSSLSPY